MAVWRQLTGTETTVKTPRYLHTHFDWLSRRYRQQQAFSKTGVSTCVAAQKRIPSAACLRIDYRTLRVQALGGHSACENTLAEEMCAPGWNQPDLLKFLPAGGATALKASGEWAMTVLSNRVRVVAGPQKHAHSVAPKNLSEFANPNSHIFKF